MGLNCPYCLQPIDRHDASFRRGPFTVHCYCQKLHERQKKPHLLPDGRLQFHDHILTPDDARNLFALYAANQQNRRTQ